MYEWILQHEDQSITYRFDERVGVFQRNNDSSIIPAPMSGVLGVLLANADSPVTPEDMYESHIGVQNSRSLKKSIKELKQHPYLGGHILQVGDNKQAIYSFLTSPQNSELLLSRMKYLHEQLHGEKAFDENGKEYVKIKQTREAEAYTQKIKKVTKTAAAMATAVTVTYAVVRHVRKK